MINYRLDISWSRDKKIVCEQLDSYLINYASQSAHKLKWSSQLIPYSSYIYIFFPHKNRGCLSATDDVIFTNILSHLYAYMQIHFNYRMLTWLALCAVFASLTINISVALQVGLFLIFLHVYYISILWSSKESNASFVYISWKLYYFSSIRLLI